jgi:hypothetical protein
MTAMRAISTVRSPVTIFLPFSSERLPDERAEESVLLVTKSFEAMTCVNDACGTIDLFSMLGTVYCVSLGQPLQYNHYRRSGGTNFFFRPRNVAVALLKAVVIIFEACEVIDVRSSLNRCGRFLPPFENAGDNSGSRYAKSLDVQYLYPVPDSCSHYILITLIRMEESHVVYN